MRAIRRFVGCALTNGVQSVLGRVALGLATTIERVGHRFYAGEPVIPHLNSLAEALEVIARVDPVRAARFRSDAPRILISRTVPNQYWWKLRAVVVNAEMLNRKPLLDLVFVFVELSVFARLQSRFGARLGSQRANRLQRDALRAQIAFAERLIEEGDLAASTYLSYYRSQVASRIRE
jgi:hypothetical protein